MTNPQDPQTTADRAQTFIDWTKLNSRALSIAVASPRIHSLKSPCIRHRGCGRAETRPPQKSEGDWVPRALPSPLQSIARPLPVSDNRGGADGSEDECSRFVFHVNPILSGVGRGGQSEPIGQFTIWSVVTFLMRKSSGRAPCVSDS